MNKEYSYDRSKAVKGEHPTYTFISMLDGVKVVRENDGDVFEHIFRKGDLVRGRTLKQFHFDDGYKNKHSVYVTSEEYPKSNAQSLANQIDIIYKNERTPSTLIEEDISSIILDSTTSATEKNCLVKARIGQGRLRKELITMWGGCAVTGCATKEVLIASHIKPWSESSNEERLSKYNGLLLIANLDKAFDYGLISFKSTGEVMVSPLFKDYRLAGVDSNMIIRLQLNHEKYLKYHRKP